MEIYQEDRWKTQYGKSVHLGKSVGKVSSLCGVQCKGFFKKEIKEFDSQYCFLCVVLFREGYRGSSYANLSRGYESPKKKKRDQEEVQPSGYIVSILRDDKRNLFYSEEWTGRSFERHLIGQDGLGLWLNSHSTSLWLPIGNNLSRMSIKPYLRT